MSIAEFIAGDVTAFVVILTLIQITPVKINPWSAIARAIGKALNTDVIERLDKSEASAARYRIIRFDDEIRHKTRHTEEHFNQILDDIDIYEAYCATHPNYPNSKAKAAIKNVRDVYQKCRREDDFFV